MSSHSNRGAATVLLLLLLLLAIWPARSYADLVIGMMRGGEGRRVPVSINFEKQQLITNDASGFYPELHALRNPYHHLLFHARSDQEPGNLQADLYDSRTFSRLHSSKLGAVRMYPNASWPPVRMTWPNHAGDLVAVLMFHEDGRYGLDVRHLDSGKRFAFIPTPFAAVRYPLVHWARDARTLIVIDRDAAKVRIYKALYGTEIKTFSLGKANYPRELISSGEDIAGRLYILSPDGRLQIGDARNAESIMRPWAAVSLWEPVRPITPMAVDPSGRYVAVGWLIAGSKQEPTHLFVFDSQRPNNPKYLVTAAPFSTLLIKRYGDTIYGANKNGEVHAFSLQNGKALQSFRAPGEVHLVHLIDDVALKTSSGTGSR